MNNYYQNILIVKPYWADLILSGSKIWEIRGHNTTKRGKIDIAKSGTGKIFGEVKLVDSIPLTQELWESSRDKHQVNLSWKELLSIYKKPHAWIFEYGSAEKYIMPVSYKHPKGAVVWVKQRIE